MSFKENKWNTKKTLMQMKSIKNPKRIINKQIKIDNKIIIQIAEMKFVNEDY